MIIIDIIINIRDFWNYYEMHVIWFVRKLLKLD